MKIYMVSLLHRATINKEHLEMYSGGRVGKLVELTTTEEKDYRHLVLSLFVSGRRQSIYKRSINAVIVQMNGRTYCQLIHSWERHINKPYRPDG